MFDTVFKWVRMYLFLFLLRSYGNVCKAERNCYDWNSTAKNIFINSALLLWYWFMVSLRYRAIRKLSPDIVCGHHCHSWWHFNMTEELFLEVKWTQDSISFWSSFLIFSSLTKLPALFVHTNYKAVNNLFILVFGHIEKPIFSGFTHISRITYRESYHTLLESGSEFRKRLSRGRAME